MQGHGAVCVPPPSTRTPLVGNVVETSTILPEILPLGLRRELEREEAVDGMWVFGVRVRIVGREDDRMAQSGILHVLRRPFVTLDRHKALTLEVVTGLHGQLGMFVPLPLLMLIQPP